MILPLGLWINLAAVGMVLGSSTVRGFVFSFELLDTVLPKMVLSHGISLCYMLQQELLPFLSQGLLLGTLKTQPHVLMLSTWQEDCFSLKLTELKFLKILYFLSSSSSSLSGMTISSLDTKKIRVGMKKVSRDRAFRSPCPSLPALGAPAVLPQKFPRDG